MRIITLFIAVVFIACNNSSEKKTDIKDTANKTSQMPATTIMPDTIFTAFGTEPFWSVYVIKDSKIVFHPAEGTDVEVPWVSALISLDTFTRQYNSSGNGNSIDLKITKKDCSDGMSDETHSYEAIVVVNKEKYSGCGREKK